MVVCTYPRLIAAYHVLHRLLVPRHPPYALNNLTVNLIILRNSRDTQLHHLNFQGTIYVELTGIEPVTSALQGRRSPS